MCTVAFAAAGCGGTSGSKFSNNAKDAGSLSNNAPIEAGALSNNNNIGPLGTNSACVSSAAKAALANANLIVMFDKSGSMGDPAEGFDPALKWAPVTAAMKAFFSDPKSVGLAASLQFFPQGTDLTSVCGYPYATPLVLLTPLATAMPLIAAIDATQPTGGTPTLPALSGAVSYAQQVASAHPLDSTLVVLVTDGDPGFGINGQFTTGCMDNDIPHVAAVAQAALAGTPPISTYVIGVGSDFTNLNAIATAGGTKQAIIVPVTNPTQTGPTFQAALNTIRAAALPCQFTIPPPPDGQQIDPMTVNVVLQTGGAQKVLPYSADCTDMTGWHYNDPTNPANVVLCASACTQAQGSGDVTIAFGCRTAGTVK
jgi:Mg-chelatase subunit ChlD